ncbi:hypothetical protein BOSE62_130514 [Bosea sp. 62]|nr:hypothetical protein BOSE7B_120529 [Bosea sp. 7B]CAD5276472.1 hypothetical protein BOSE21B_30384 [Bosea sp. 21B]CAD5277641.1 hypothetical protein BOSE46_40037 [Bosea sp. 46]VVT59876.1 hypothetical protein BOS5A_210667 [Bosea sp. EC-HK365B]VXB47067.1 hypothetical protein BOSE62_130514 [Bosea sp. 62]VXC08610.1 hypothetical protein BOSE127_170167 [Bosea sp. 127]VXC22259.1 hypothetical protein BOSE29B_30365 [Bosea sp. 29B]VXC75111.1 hypothetical protein BOSE125_50037 [Bosea sp. 125]
MPRGVSAPQGRSCAAVPTAPRSAWSSAGAGQAFDAAGRRGRGPHRGTDRRRSARPPCARPADRAPTWCEAAACRSGRRCREESRFSAHTLCRSIALSAASSGGVAALWRFGGHLVREVPHTIDSASRRGRLWNCGRSESLQTTTGEALRASARAKDCKVGAIVFSRTGDPTSGDWDGAVIHEQWDETPAGFEDMAAALWKRSTTPSMRGRRTWR